MSDDLDIAIVGMSGRFPGARTLDEFWRNLAAGVESITRFSDEALLAAGVPAPCLGDPRYVKAAPVLEDPGRFDAAFFGYSPMEARTMDPQHRVLLELAHEALEHAGCDPARYPGRIAVYAGAAMNTYFTSVGLNSRLAGDYIPTLIGNDKDFLSTRISYKLNLKGPSITVQTACSSSMVAVHLARQSLLSGEADMALAGGVSIRVPHRAGYYYDGGGVASPDGRVRAFDARASGTVFGSGGGILVLKRLADALADGDTVHAVIKGSAVNNDGSEKAGYTAPSVNSQADAVVEALANAGVAAEDITYIEAHGSGTPVGDPIEVTALTKAFRASTRRSGYCALGSVKTNIGHLDAAAAVAGMIKTVLALRHRQLPPSLHYTEPNPEIDFPATPFYVNTQLRDWTSEGPRRAGVMATGMGGTNAHVVLEEAPEPPAPAAGLPSSLLVLSARTESALDQATHRLREFLESNGSVNLEDVAHTLRAGRKAFEHRRYAVCSGREGAITALGQADANRAGSIRTGESRRPVIFLLPGVGDHYAGMGHELYETWPVFREEVDRCARLLKPHLGIDIRSIIYPPGREWSRRVTTGTVDLRKMLGRTAGAPDDRDTEALNQTLYAQPALFTIEYATSRLWQSLGVTPDAIVGHSLGEYVAACLAGVMSLEDALRLIATRARLVNALPRAAMLAVMLPENELRSLLPEGIAISLINGPCLCVVAGPVGAIAAFEKTMIIKGVICRYVQNGHPFHTEMLSPIVEAFAQAVRAVPLREPSIPYISNVTGTWITGREATDPAYWARHATRTARFSDALGQLWRHKDAVLVEAGPGRTLSVLAMQHPGRQDGGNPLAVPSLRHDYESQSDLELLWHGIGRLWVSGADIRWGRVPSGGHRRKIPLPTYPFEGEQHWLEPLPAALPAARSLQKNPNPSEWLYVPSWKRLLPPAIGLQGAVPVPEQRTSWLVFSDECGLAPVLTEQLKSAGHDVIAVMPGREFQQLDGKRYTIDPSNAQHHDLLIRSLHSGQTDRIVHAWSITDAASSAGGEFERAKARGFYSLLFLARALAARHAGDAIQLFVLSNGIQDVCGSETLCPEKSTLLGPCMVIGQEYPNIRVRSIDLDLPCGDHARTADLVIGELRAPDSSLFAAYRNGQRWIQAYEPVAENPARDGSRSFRAGGVYLITGGLGGIGIAISEYLARNYGAKLVLTGRSDLPERASWGTVSGGLPAGAPMAARIRAIEKIEELGGEVLYASASAADVGAMRAVVEKAYERFGALHGVIHGAGLVGADREIADIDARHCDEHFRAKAHGALVLEQVLDGKPLDFCLLLSSLTSVLGGVGQAAYASSNIYLDSLARRHNRCSTVPWLSVNWDVWRLEDRAGSLAGPGTTLRDLGMSAAEATGAMERVLAMKQAGQLVVSTGDLNARIDQWIKLESLNARATAAAGKPARLQRDSAPRTGNSGQPRDETEQRVAHIWQEALGLDSIGIHDGFARLGGHSLLAVRIVAELRKAFQVDLPVRVLFDAPTVAELSRYIKERIVAEIEALTDEEAGRLVSNG